MLVVYLANQYIRIIDGDVTGGKLQVRAAYCVKDERGCILNGAITDKEGLTDILAKMWEDYNLPRKAVRLVLGGNQFTTTITKAPVLKPQQMQEYISREFLDVDRITDPVYTYSLLPDKSDSKKVMTVLASAVEKSYVQEYIQLFQGIGVDVERIETAREAMIRYAEVFHQFEVGGGILQFADGSYLRNILIHEGCYIYSSSERIFSNPGTVEYGVELARTVSNILQFIQAQGLSIQVEEVHIAGLDEGDMLSYIDSLQQVDENILVKTLDGGDKVDFAGVDEDEISKYLLTAAGMLGKETKGSLMSQMRRDPEKEAAKKKRKKILIPLAVIAAIFLCVAAFLGIRVLGLSKQLNELQAYNSREDVQATCDEYDAVNSELQTTRMIRSSMEGLKQNVLTYPRVDSATERTVAACASGLVTAEISSYTAEDGILSFNASAGNAEQIHRFIELLSQQDIFAAVDYTGYEQDSDGQWNVKVNCIMAARQEAEDETNTNG